MNVFDIMGPVMIGPSSSHTAGAARIGLIARSLLEEAPVEVHILLHGSFAKTYKGHGTDKAIIAGILGMQADDSRIRFSPEIAGQEGIQVEITEGEIETAHPNTAEIVLKGKSGKKVSLRGSSVGGGNSLVTRLNGMEVSLTGQNATLIILHKDAPGTIASVTDIISDYGANICNFRLARKSKGGQAVMTIETDGNFKEDLNEKIKKLPNIYSSTILLPI